jgi:hypothetical protein
MGLITFCHCRLFDADTRFAKYPIAGHLAWWRSGCQVVASPAENHGPMNCVIAPWCQRAYFRNSASPPTAIAKAAHVCTDIGLRRRLQVATCQCDQVITTSCTQRFQHVDMVAARPI